MDRARGIELEGLGMLEIGLGGIFETVLQPHGCAAPRAALSSLLLLCLPVT